MIGEVLLVWAIIMAVLNTIMIAMPDRILENRKTKAFSVRVGCIFAIIFCGLVIMYVSGVAT